MTTRAGPSLTDTLRDDVLGGQLPPGTRLLEIQLAEHYEVSRAAIRAAINELVKEGLVDREANRGATVRRVALDEAIQIAEVRGLLEGLVASRAAEVATAADRLELQAIVARMHEAVAAEQFSEYSELNGVLHRRLREISGHAIAADLIGNLRNRATHHHVRLALVPGRATESLSQHAEIVDAVVAGDAARAELAMRHHLDSVRETLRQWGDLIR